ncbi:uncharacterized protein STEHIDRAFT_157374 [Stereum hirsutum FP-91666 SS1]|uniref:uncharacterized protein n=1 Tax=Stereum hirsutum (strain FP-91666) TaxID=721885 RepID=UPI000444A4CC|nr:uncharacterized protein STEHIDRAFT_157374 [Stereum hirsutum FP-91666 SS1]EIM85838.1 hypothetical protein STEHIDRAFT_157374 [Stereum hirsutum FP-91666 SS1]
MSAPNTQPNPASNTQANPAPNSQTNPTSNAHPYASQPNPTPNARPYNILLTLPNDHNIPIRPLYNVAVVTQDLATSGLQVYVYPTRERENIPHQATHINEEGYRVNAEGRRMVPSLSFNKVPTATQAALFPIGGNTVQFRAPVRSNLIARDQFRVDLKRANQLVNVIIDNTAQGRHPFYKIATTMKLSISRAIVNPRSPHNINLAHIPLNPNGASIMHKTEEPTQGQMPPPYIPHPPTPFMPARPQTPYHQPQPEASTRPFRPPSPVRPARFPVDNNSDSDILNNPPARPQPSSQTGTSSTTDSLYYPASVLPRLPLYFHNYLTRVRNDTQFIDVLAHVSNRDVQAQALTYRRVQAEIDAQSSAIEARKQELSLTRR